MTDETQRRLTAIISADIAGYSSLMGRDEAGTLAALRQFRSEQFVPTVGRYRGSIVKNMGDGWLVAFDSSGDAVACALKVQEILFDQEILKLRIGIHIGDITYADADIYGDGVNIAARLQEIAEPGAIVISDVVMRSIDGKLADEFSDLGQQALKNIAQPVAAFGWGMTAVRNEFGASIARDKPSIAVLPFDNMSGDPEQDFFADGMTEDIITELSRFGDLLVIARNSAFTYKGRTESAAKVGADLRVEYIVEGSVRKSNDRVRVTVQLIDCDNGGQIWADRYDRELVDVFDLQDELTLAIVGLLPGRIRSAEMTKVQRKIPKDMVALDCLMAGKIHHHRATKVDNEKALQLLNKAIELDPEFGVVYAWKACTLGQAIEFGFDTDVEKLEAEAISAVQTALSFDENDVECHRLLCEVNMERKLLEEATSHNRRALTINPNDPRLIAQRGELLTWLGRPAEGVEYIEKALRLDPFDTVSRAHLLGRALFGCEQYEDALAAYRNNPSPRYGQLAEMAACHERLGERDQAKKLTGKVLQLYPAFKARNYVAGLPFKNSSNSIDLIQSLTDAGLPEGDL